MPLTTFKFAGVEVTPSNLFSSAAVEVIPVKVFSSLVERVAPSRTATSPDVSSARLTADPDWQLESAVRSASSVASHLSVSE